MTEIITNLVSATNREGKITNYGLELAALILHEATLLTEVHKARLDVPHSGSDNTLIVS